MYPLTDSHRNDAARTSNSMPVSEIKKRTRFSSPKSRIDAIAAKCASLGTVGPYSLGLNKLVSHRLQIFKAGFAEGILGWAFEVQDTDIVVQEPMQHVHFCGKARVDDTVDRPFRQ